MRADGRNRRALTPEARRHRRRLLDGVGLRLGHRCIPFRSVAHTAPVFTLRDGKVTGWKNFQTKSEALEAAGLP
jgi:hypothetical protein